MRKIVNLSKNDLLILSRDGRELCNVIITKSSRFDRADLCVETNDANLKIRRIPSTQ